MKRLLIWIRVLIYFIKSFTCTKKSRLLSVHETINNSIQYNKSLIRFGDGEFIIINGKSIHYQKQNERLRNYLVKIMEDYINNPKDCNYMVCMPNQFLNCNGLKIAKKRLWISCWSETRYLFKTNYDKNVTYGDSFLFSSKYSNVYNKLWMKKDKIIFLHNNKIYAQNFEQKYNIETIFIQVPKKNAFDKFDELLCKVKYEVDKSQEDIAVLISAGPCAKVLVYELSKNGVFAIDTGHCWDDPLITIDDQ